MQQSIQLHIKTNYCSNFNIYVPAGICSDIAPVNKYLSKYM